jgi:hypothetical protein
MKRQEIYCQEQSQSCYLARLSCFHLHLKIIRNPTDFALACSHPNFAVGVLQNIFEPGVAGFFFKELRTAFLRTDFIESQVQFIPGLAKVLEACAQNTAKEDHAQLAELTFHFVMTSFVNKISIFIPLFPFMLKYVVEDPKVELARQCFSFLSIAAQEIAGFRDV